MFWCVLLDCTDLSSNGMANRLRDYILFCCALGEMDDVLHVVLFLRTPYKFSFFLIGNQKLPPCPGIKHNGQLPRFVDVQDLVQIWIITTLDEDLPYTGLWNLTYLKCHFSRFGTLSKIWDSFCEPYPIQPNSDNCKIPFCIGWIALITFVFGSVVWGRGVVADVCVCLWQYENWLVSSLHMLRFEQERDIEQESDCG